MVARRLRQCRSCHLPAYNGPARCYHAFGNKWWIGCRLISPFAGPSQQAIRSSPKTMERTMHGKLLMILAASTAVMLLPVATQPVLADGTAALTGQVSSEAEGNMEGV